MKKVLDGMIAIAKSRPFVAVAFGGIGFMIGLASGLSI